VCPTPTKKVYATRLAAERSNGGGGNRPMLFPYHCKCGWWHLGTQREPQGPRADCPTPDKVGFATEDLAKKRAMTVGALRGEDLRAYECKCGWWHLTKK
jgi:hypothetical protein